MNLFKTIATLSISLFLVPASPSLAHSLKHLEDKLSEKEKYFHSFDKKAPKFTLQDWEDKPVSLDDFRGKVVILHFVYTNCVDVCPLHTERIADIQKMISGTAMRDLVQFVTITTDPSKDTQEVMRGYGKTHGLKDQNWIFLTSGSDRLNSTLELVTEFGHKFTKINNGIQTHGVVTHIISRDGRWRANFHSLKFNSTNLIIFVNALTNDIHSRKPK
ncbi:SCO family protein [Alphaproteobacteria bacterium]|nr:SCO family protein [Alphaproteobacteria bacterium]